MIILLLLPVVLYIALGVFNLALLSESQTINIFNFMDITAPTLLYSSIFFVAYLVLIFLIFDLKWVFQNKKIDNLEAEVFGLKSKLYDEREDILKEFINDYKSKLDNFTKEQTALFEKFKSESEVDLLKQKAETDRILEKLNLLDKGIFDQIKSAFKWKN